jgi:hypothetical protein
MSSRKRSSSGGTRATITVRDRIRGVFVPPRGTRTLGMAVDRDAIARTPNACSPNASSNSRAQQ